MRRLLASSLAAVFLALPAAARADTVTFNYAGATQFWDVPAGVTQATFDLYGAQGGGARGGKGGRVGATFSVTPGERLLIYVGGGGGQAATGFNGGGAGGASGAASFGGYGGGGATDVRRGGTALANRLMVAAGGGGGSIYGGGGASGQNGTSPGDGIGGGKAGTASAGGAAGGGGGGNTGNPGALGGGGAGQGVAVSNFRGGGGGGGGLYGGGGGRGDTMGYDGGGGGGSSMIARSDLVVAGAFLQDGVRSGSGTASVTFAPPPATPATGGGQGTPSAVDTLRPVLRGLSFSRSSFAAARSGASTSGRGKRKAKKKPIGTKVSFSLSEPGSVRFRVERKARGRKVGKRCVKPKRSNRKKAKCTRWTTVRGSFTVTGKAGRNSFTFRGRIAGKALRRGTYRLIGVAADRARNPSAPVNRTFKII